MMNPLLEAIRAGTAPKMIKTAAARGALPLPPEVLLESQVILAGDRDDSVRQAANEGLRDYATEDLVVILENKELPATVLKFCATFFRDRAPVLEKIILNTATENETYAMIAPVVSASLADLIITNQVRLIECPEILYRLRENPNLSPGSLKRLDEIEKDFFGAAPTAAMKAPAAPLPEPGTLPPPPEAPALEAAPPEAEEEEKDSEPSPEEVAYIEEVAGEDQEKLTLLQRISKMPVSSKIKAALIGNREVRCLLVRDSNRLVATTVMASPKITETEIELFSQLRNVNEEVLRMIGNNREWTKNIKIAKNLVKNPRAPVNISMGLLPRLTTLDLKMLEKDKSVPDCVRQQAKRLATKRLEAAGGAPSGGH
ncbi:MAG: hypothetical protein KA419_19825 [Acidobacteria bacterium]|nr:hypothetical protein [Acidobacteriota bacterium]